MQGTLPSEWGVNGMFPNLTTLSVSYNPPLSGALPTTWGSDNSSFTSLRLFEANNCNLTGGLPAEWAAQLPSLTHINISSNALTGLSCKRDCSSLPLTCSAELLWMSSQSDETAAEGSCVHVMLLCLQRGSDRLSH